MMLSSFGISRAVAAARWQQSLAAAMRTMSTSPPIFFASSSHATQRQWPQQQQHRHHLPFQIHRLSSLSDEESDSEGGHEETVPPSKVVTRTTLAEGIAEEHDLSVAKSRRIVDSVLDGIVESLSGAGGEDVEVRLSNFGVFDRRLSPSRKVRNPRTGEVLTTVAKQRVRFRASKAFKDAANER